MAAADDPHQLPAVLAELKNEARSQGLWNLFLPDKRWGAGLSVLDYAPLAEITGRSPHLAPEALNCSAPDTGNMEILSMFGTEEQQKRWLTPLLDGDIRSCFSMTEPDVASSDATNIRTSITRQGDEYVIDGRKWFSSGALNPRCRLSIVMGVTNPEADSHRRQSMILVPLDTPGVEIERDISVYGYHDRGGHAQIRFEGVRVPATNLLGEVGSGFAIAQARLGPGRIHHCMRALGMAERALELMCRRAADRAAFGVALADQGVVQGWIAESRIMIEQARLLVFKAAWLIDNQGSRQARTEIAAIKVVAPRVATWVLDRAVQLFGAAGVTADFPLAQMWSHARGLQIADGPDEVHLRTVARVELGRHREGTR
jgi:acyl-CoA dehydrogenase